MIIYYLLTNHALFISQSDEVCKATELYNKAVADANELRDRIDSMSGSNECQRDEIKQLQVLYQTECKATKTLEQALNTEKENFK